MVIIRGRDKYMAPNENYMNGYAYNGFAPNIVYDIFNQKNTSYTNRINSSLEPRNVETDHHSPETISK